MDRGPPRNHDASFLRHWHFARSAARLAAGATLDAMVDAAALGIARDPVLPARADPDLSPGFPAAAPADFWRLFRGRWPGAQLAFRLGCGPARAAPRIVHHPGRNRRLGGRNARHD